MANMENIVKLGIDTYRGTVSEYSKEESLDVMRQALIEANGGSTQLNLKNLRSNGAAIFAIVEEILDTLIVDALKEDDAFNKIVDFKNIAAGDENRFVVDNQTLYKVSKLADGTQALRRQRIAGKKAISIDTDVHGVKIYDDLSRVLAGVIDWNEFVDRAYRSVKQAMLQDIVDLWSTFSSGDLGSDFIITSGSYNEATFLALVDKVEAAAGGKPATIIGTKSAIRPLNASIASTGDLAKDDLYKMGYVGKYFGTDVIAVPQRFQNGTTTEALPTDKVLVVAGDAKPIKCVFVGDSFINDKPATDNADLTQEFVLLENWGVALAMDVNTGIGLADLA